MIAIIGVLAAKRSIARIPGRILHLDASKLTLNDGDPVTTWPDLSGNGFDATGSGTARPTFKTAIQNGLPVIRFDIDDLLTIPHDAALNSDNVTVFMVGAHGAQALFLFGKWTSGGGTPISYLFQTGSGKLEFLVSNAVGTDFEAITTTSINDGVFRLFTGRHEFNVSNKIFVNGVEEGSVSGANSSTANNQNVQIQNFSGVGSTVDFAEMIVYNRVLSTLDQQFIENALIGKWGL